MNRPLRIGLTGGIGCGKSTIAGLFSELGVPVYDADHIVHDLTAPQQPALHEIRTLFGDSILKSDQSLDRAKLRDQIFKDDGKRSQLETILHPRVYHTLEQLTEQETNTDYVVWVVPLLLETNAAGRVDRVLVVDCPGELQIERAATREGLNPDQVRLIIKHQIDRAERLKLADDIIDNTGSMEDARQRVAVLHEQYLQLAAERAARSGYSH